MTRGERRRLTMSRRRDALALLTATVAGVSLAACSVTASVGVQSVNTPPPAVTASVPTWADPGEAQPYAVPWCFVGDAGDELPCIDVTTGALVEDAETLDVIAEGPTVDEWAEGLPSCEGASPSTPCAGARDVSFEGAAGQWHQHCTTVVTSAESAFVACPDGYTEES